LRNPEIGKFDDVATLVNQPFGTIQEAIARIYDSKKPDDLILLYFSGHGLLDMNGNLHLATIETIHNLPRVKSIPASFIANEMSNSRSRKQILILDSCHSGAFSRGVKGSPNQTVGTGKIFEGNGRIVLTASDVTQYAYEGDDILGEGTQSVFTRHLVTGLETGVADQNRDGIITADELYDYLYTEVVNENPKQTPIKWNYGQSGSFILARSPIEESTEELLEEIISDSDEDVYLESRVYRSTDFREARPHAFVVMPFGKKQGFDGTIIDFNAIYQDLIKPALEEAGFEPFRADEETTTGDILTDMFQELLLADLAICDLSIDNANVYYELGIRHAFRKRGVVHIQSGRAYMPFDIFNVRTISYHTNDEGVPDPEHREKDIQAIARVCRDTWASDQDAIHSPVFNLLTGLDEPDRRDLRTPLATGFWREYNEWRQRVSIAQRQKRIGDILLLTEEISNPLIKEEAIDQAGRALRSMERHELALQQYRQGLELNSRNLRFRREESFHLNRLGRVDEAIVKLEDLLRDHPDDTEATAYLGRIYRDMWTESWLEMADETKRIDEAYKSSHWLMKSIQTYMKGFLHNLNEYYPGINALTLSIIYDELAKKFEDDSNPDVEEIRTLLPSLKGTLELTLTTLAKDESSDYWTLTSLAELWVLTADSPFLVRRAYQKALIAARKNIYNLLSSISQLSMLKSLTIRSDFVEIGIQVLQDEINRIRKEAPEIDEADYEEMDAGWVVLFSGHKIDVGDDAEQRLKPEMEQETRKRIDAALDKFDIGNNDLGITAGSACGGEIIFIEACLERGMAVEVCLPISESDYIKRNISYAGDEWVERFYNIRNHPLVKIVFQQDHVGKVKAGDDPYERNNRWALYSSLINGVDRVRLLALWDGKMSYTDQDGYLVAHMVEEMRRLGGYVEHIDTTKFDYWQAGGMVGKALDRLAELEE
jgi:tetratricopeptide (TPR) repeat protein